MFDPENKSLKNISEDRGAIRSVYLVPEECDVRYTYWNSNDGKEEVDTLHADAGDILINFWEDDFSTPWILVKSEAWKGNIEAYRAAEQKRKEEWAKKKKSDSVTADGNADKESESNF